jgi:hypothetical protein
MGWASGEQPASCVRAAAPLAHPIRFPVRATPADEEEPHQNRPPLWVVSQGSRPGLHPTAAL